MTRRASWLVALTGAVLLIGAPAIWSLTRPADQVGDLGAAGLDGEVEPTDDGPDASPEAPSTGEVTDRDAGAAATEAAPATTADSPRLRAGELSGPLQHHPVPTMLSIPAIDADAPVVPVALEDDGSMEIPADVNVVGWYEPGVRPGEDGTAVLSGHVDSRSQGPGVLYDLRRVDVGDTIVTTGADGAARSWQVVARARYGKAELPISEVFVRTGPPRLAVITCGGEFDPATRSYSDNVVVIAEPAA